MTTRQQYLAEYIDERVERGEAVLLRDGDETRTYHFGGVADPAELPDGRYAAVGYYANNAYDIDASPIDAAGEALWMIVVTKTVPRACAHLASIPGPFFPEAIIDLDEVQEIEIKIRVEAEVVEPAGASSL